MKSCGRTSCRMRVKCCGTCSSTKQELHSPPPTHPRRHFGSQDIQGEYSSADNYLHKFFTKSMISDSKCQKSKKVEIWNSRDLKIQFLEGVIFLSRNSSQNQ